MAGRRIRWASAGKLAAIGAAAVIGIASLPALLGGDAPPPVPADVGLVPPPPTNSVPTAVPSAPMTPATPPRAAHRDHHRDLALADRRRDHDDRKRDHSGKDRDRGGAVNKTAPPTPTVTVTPPAYARPPVYSYVPPPDRGEFQIEP
jgi:hypothetical protein